MGGPAAAGGGGLIPRPRPPGPYLLPRGYSRSPKSAWSISLSRRSKPMSMASSPAAEMKECHFLLSRAAESGAASMSYLPSWWYPAPTLSTGARPRRWQVTLLASLLNKERSGWFTKLFIAAQFKENFAILFGLQWHCSLRAKAASTHTHTRTHTHIHAHTHTHTLFLTVDVGIKSAEVDFLLKSAKTEVCALSAKKRAELRRSPPGFRCQNVVRSSWMRIKYFRVKIGVNPPSQLGPKSGPVSAVLPSGLHHGVIFCSTLPHGLLGHERLQKSYEFRVFSGHLSGRSINSGSPIDSGTSTFCLLHCLFAGLSCRMQE